MELPSWFIDMPPAVAISPDVVGEGLSAPALPPRPADDEIYLAPIAG